MKKILLSLLAIFLIIEEWIWDVLTAWGRSLIARLRLESLEQRIAELSPKWALIAFLIPLLLVTPINLAALILLAHGLILQGVLLELVAKFVGTLLVSRVFALTKPQLLTFRAIAVIYSTIMGWLRWAHQKIVETKTYQLIKAIQGRIKMFIRNRV